MTLSKSFPYLFLLFLPSSIVFAQTITSYTAYQTSFPYVTSCPSTQYYDTALLQCSPCPANTVQKSNDVTQCDCANNSSYYGVNQGGGSLLCLSCNTTYIRSSDGFGCISAYVPCNSSTSNNFYSESDITGDPYGTLSLSSDQPRIGDAQCNPCQNGTWPDSDGQRCTPCASVTPRLGATVGSITCCAASDTKDGICLTYLGSISNTYTSPNNLNRFTSATTSSFIQQHLEASIHLCRMNLNSTTVLPTTRTLLSNATACQVLANIAAMQFYYGSSGYAFYYYENYIWTSATDTISIWSASSIRTSIPFLAYPSTFYTEITGSTYNWISSTINQNDIIRFKLAKYSATGQFLGLVDAVDSIIQLCGGAYTNGRSAFTFGTEFKQSCNIRVDALWNSTLYETAFFDPYIVFTRSGFDYMLPSPVVITNYQSSTTSGSSPNQNSDESLWTYHRRFFLLDRISGITPITGGTELRNIHYAKSIKILNTLTSGTTYMEPPVVVIQYGELSSSDIGKGTIIQVTFESHYRMNLDSHILGIWIAVGVLSALGIILAFGRTSIWQSRSGKEIIDLITIGKLFMHIINALATIFFIVMGGVSLWWLIFYKRQGAVYLVMPTTIQQASFTSLVVIAFALKSFDIIHLIFQQASMDIFFIDWEKAKAGAANQVSVRRTYFVANEYHEIEIFRRVNLTFLLFFVLFLLKVINLENVATAQPDVTLFPSSSDYQSEYNGILRVGIALAMWLAAGLIQYLIYVLFYKRFVEDKLLNFIDLCSVSNISVFMLTLNNYGYYIHGRSPHGATDVNMRDMILNLERESKQMSGTRGLQPKSDEQIFIIKIDKTFREQYDFLIQNYQNRIFTRKTKKGDEHESEILMVSYRNLNDFLCAFINHSLPTYNYIIRDRTFFEKIFNYEFLVPSVADPQGQSTFFVDTENNFTKAIFAGHETALFTWNMATFLFIDYFAFNYVLAAIVTYLLNIIAEKMRLSLGGRNLSAKTLIPKNFLI